MDGYIHKYKAVSSLSVFTYGDDARGGTGLDEVPNHGGQVKVPCSVVIYFIGRCYVCVCGGGGGGEFSMRVCCCGDGGGRTQHVNNGIE